MADEITFSGSLAYADDEGADVALSIAQQLADVTSQRYTLFKQTIGTSEEGIKLGELATVGWALFVNRDITNFINLKVGTGGAIFAKLFPGEFALLRMGSGAQAPFAIADTDVCKLEVLLIEV